MVTGAQARRRAKQAARAGQPARAQRVDERAVRAALGEVADPELPAVSIVDLGIVEDVTVTAGAIRVSLLPTWVGCPAFELIESAVRERLLALAADHEVVVERSFGTPWTSDRISPVGREALRRSGIGPPLPEVEPGSLVALSVPVPCPYCGSTRTVLENAFGPTACRSIRYCTACRQPFEQFKAV